MSSMPPARRHLIRVLVGRTITPMHSLTERQQKALAVACIVLASAWILVGCAVNSDGSITAGFRGSPAWIEHAPHEDVQAYFDGQSVPDLCWALYYESGTKCRTRREAVLSEIVQSLNRRGLTAVSCNDYPPLNRQREPLMRAPPNNSLHSTPVSSLRSSAAAAELKR